MGGSFWLKRVEEKNKLEKNLASYSFDPTLYKDKIQQFKEQAAEVDQVANSIHQTITNTMVSSFQALADGLAGISDMNAGQAIASLLKSCIVRIFWRWRYSCRSHLGWYWCSCTSWSVCDSIIRRQFRKFKLFP